MHSRNYKVLSTYTVKNSMMTARKSLREKPKMAQEVLSSVAVLCLTAADEEATGLSLARKA
jgi:hypothetical protein